MSSDTLYPGILCNVLTVRHMYIFVTLEMEVDSSSDSEPMDVQFPSGPKKMPWKHEPPPPMKISQKKPVQAPKSIPQVKTTRPKSKQQQQQQKQQQPQPSKSKTKPAGQEKEKIFGLGKQEKTNDTGKTHFTMTYIILLPVFKFKY